MIEIPDHSGATLIAMAWRGNKRPDLLITSLGVIDVYARKSMI